MLTDGSQYLAHILIKGLKGEYPPVVSFLMEVYAASKHFTNLIKKEEGGAVEMVLNIMKGGLYSKSKDVATWALKVLSKIAYDLANLELNKNSWEWFIAVDGGLDGAVYCMQKHPDVLAAAIEMLINFGKENMNELFTQFLKNVINDVSKYWRLISSAIKPLSQFKIGNDEKLQKGLESVLSCWLDSCSRMAENDGRHSVNERGIALGVLSEIWMHFSQCVEAKEEVAERVLSVIRRASRDKNSALQIYSLTLLFGLLEVFAAEKKAYAPIIYKALAFTFLETHAQETIREFIMGNLGLLYASMPAIPISIVTEPLIKQVQTSENITYFFNLFDFAFVSLIAGHPKLNIKNALQILDMLARTLLNDALFSAVAVQSFIKTSAKFGAEPAVSEFLLKFVNVTRLPHLLGRIYNAAHKYQQMLEKRSQGKAGQDAAQAERDPRNGGTEKGRGNSRHVWGPENY